ncbi:mini-ribonuclease [Salix suchowensis]|nr:mini-ribonuclease [Salix suchowensis]
MATSVGSMNVELLYRRVRVRDSSVDTQQRLPYNPNAPRNPFKNLNPKPNNVVPTSTASSPAVASLLRQFRSFSNARLLLFKVLHKKLDGSYLGYERWLPSPPKVEKPRSVFNAATLAYIGDSIFELYARRHFLFPPLSIEEHNDRVMAVVRCEAQDALLQKLLNDNYLSEEERVVLRWGKNVGSTKTRTKRRVGVAVYNRASSLETLVGFLYLTNVSRLEEVMLKLGFSTDSSTQMILKETKSNTLTMQVN